jgi:hypothetical protein
MAMFSAACVGLFCFIRTARFQPAISSLGRTLEARGGRCAIGEIIAGPYGAPLTSSASGSAAGGLTGCSGASAGDGRYRRSPSPKTLANYLILR